MHDRLELKDLEQKCKNQAKEVKLFGENHIQAVKDEIGEEVQKLAIWKHIANLPSKLSSDLKTVKTKASSTEDSIKHIYNNSMRLKIKCVYLSSHSSHNYKKQAIKTLHHNFQR